jgi:hypothetical protein
MEPERWQIIVAMLLVPAVPLILYALSYICGRAFFKGKLDALRRAFRTDRQKKEKRG